jgi:hypothetical protein
MKMSETLGALAAAMAAAQSEIRAVQKDSTNPHFKNHYASLDTILETVRPTLAKHGLSLMQGASTPHTDEAGRITAFAVETMLLHKSGEYITNTAVMPLAKHDPQGAGGALTYGRRYGVSALLALATEEDDDGNSAMPTPHQRAQQMAQQVVQASAPAPAAAPQPAPQAAPANGASASAPTCPECAGPMWDNREGKRNPKAPDFKCKDKQCEGVIWPPKSGAPGSAAVRAPGATPTPTAPDEEAFDVDAYAPDHAMPF